MLNETKDPATETEREYLARYDLNAYDRPSVAVDVVVLTVNADGLQVALYERTQHPQRGTFALPGGFVHLDESLDDAAARLLREKAGLQRVFVEQLFTFGAPKRDPRGRVITVAYYSLVAPNLLPNLAPNVDDTQVARARVDVPWPGETGGAIVARNQNGDALPLFVDHADMIGVAVKRIRGKLDYTPIGFQLLPPAFTLRELQAVHESIRGEPLNKDSFRRRMLASGHLEATGDREQDVSYRPAELYRFVRRSAV